MYHFSKKLVLDRSKAGGVLDWEERNTFNQAIKYVSGNYRNSWQKIVDEISKLESSKISDDVEHIIQYKKYIENQMEMQTLDAIEVLKKCESNDHDSYSSPGMLQVFYRKVIADQYRFFG